MGVPTLKVGYTSATTGWGDHEVYKGHVVALERKKNLIKLCETHMAYEYISSKNITT
jgi:hypothetical protein